MRSLFRKSGFSVGSGLLSGARGISGGVFGSGASIGSGAFSGSGGIGSSSSSGVARFVSGGHRITGGVFSHHFGFSGVFFGGLFRASRKSKSADSSGSSENDLAHVMLILEQRVNQARHQAGPKACSSRLRRVK